MIWQGAGRDIIKGYVHSDGVLGKWGSSSVSRCIGYGHRERDHVDEKEWKFEYKA